MSFLAYSYPRRDPIPEPTRLLTFVDNYTDPNGLTYRVDLVDNFNNTYRVSLFIDRAPEELEGIKKKDLPSGRNRFFRELKLRASRKFYQTPDQAVISIHEAETQPNTWKTATKNTTSIMPQSTPLDLFQWLFGKGLISPDQDEYLAKEIYVDAFTLNSGSIDYRGLYLSMLDIATPPAGAGDNDYSRRPTNFLDDEVWYLTTTMTDIDVNILDNLKNGNANPNFLYNNKTNWRRYLQGMGADIIVIDRGNELYKDVVNILTRDRSLRFSNTPKPPANLDLQGNVFQGLGKWVATNNYLVGHLIDINPNIRINFDTAKFGLVEQDMNGATPEEKQAALGKATDEMDALLGFMDLHKEIRCVIQGHTDRQGEPAFDNATLSLQRATSVQNYFLAGGLEADRIIRVEGLGSLECDAATYPDPDQPSCRKITVLFYMQ